MQIAQTIVSLCDNPEDYLRLVPEGMVIAACDFADIFDENDEDLRRCIIVYGDADEVSALHAYAAANGILWVARFVEMGHWPRPEACE